MTNEEKRPLAMLGTTIIVFAAYTYIAYLRFEGNELYTMDNPKFFATAILLFLPISVFARIIIYILYSIVNTMLTGEDEPSMNKDEFGKLIDLKSSTNFYRIFIAGFLLAMLTQVVGWSIGSMFIVFYISMFVGAVISEFSEYYYLRKGV
ncbi:MAG: hypothetical protein JXR19_04160 [Bacteroidia bacterium]